MSRRSELAAGLASVQQRIETACAQVGRDPGSVRLIVVTKTFPADDVRLLAELGVTDVGENKHQEAVDKHAQCADLGLRWHFVGGLQSNKAAAVSAYCDVVHSVDRRKLITGLANGARGSERRVGCLVQVSLGDGEEPQARSGADPAHVLALANRVAYEPDLDLLGVMGVCPLGGDPVRAFDLLAAAAQQLQSEHPGASVISAGMSGDLETAIGCGATHVRVGTAVLGAREVLR
ncbi:MAG TPA: YggS family pyridoxal phosphate-dependent enzyme [Nocardioidaceae bacterium]|nr:YggS family pyridoxal phosphate-dependent enzyme [Nocardioidaceae bacterium]